MKYITVLIAQIYLNQDGLTIQNNKLFSLPIRMQLHESCSFFCRILHIFAEFTRGVLCHQAPLIKQIPLLLQRPV